MGHQLEDKKEFEECVDKKDIFDGDAPLFDTTKPPGDSFCVTFRMVNQNLEHSSIAFFVLYESM